jgi:NADH-quinone oxidoreductase subunit L
LTASEFTSSPFLLSLILLGLPLISACVAFSIQDKFAWLSPVVSSFFLLITFSISIALLFQFNIQLTHKISVDWFLINNKPITIGFLLDAHALVMIAVVSFVSLLVHIFSAGYMAGDKDLVRYFGLLGFFTFAMLGLVMSSNLLLTFCFWELVGFSSYRLIGHWYQKPSAAQASTKAFLLNKVGDLGFLIGLMILWTLSGNLDINSLSPISSPLLTAVGIFIFIGVIGKSAQFPLFNWLPDAMEGPTPVSALIHAATMVAAGVYLLVRIEPVFTADCLMIISVVGSITAVVGALGALFQFDIKRILAYSTISQLGFMVMAIGSNAAEGSFLHLLHHGFFKAGLFLGAGSIIHAMLHAQSDIDVQDIRNLGGLRKKIPVTFFGFLICSAALAGLPLTSGFLSKELILSDMGLWAGSTISWRWIVLGAAWLVTFLTPLYTIRMVWYVFFKESKHEIQIKEVPPIMQAPVILLSVGAITFLLTPGTWQLTSVIGRLLPFSNHTDSITTMVSLLVIFTSLAVGYFIYRQKESTPQSDLASPQFYLDWLNNRLVKGILFLSNMTELFDRKWIDYFIHGIAYVNVTLAHMVGWSDRKLVDGLVTGTAYSARGIGAITRSLANGKIQSYLLWAMAALVIFIFWILY